MVEWLTEWMSHLVIWGVDYYMDERLTD